MKKILIYFEKCFCGILIIFNENAIYLNMELSLVNCEYHVQVQIYSCLPSQTFYLSHYDASRSNITPCDRIDKPLVVYRFDNTAY